MSPRTVSPFEHGPSLWRQESRIPRRCHFPDDLFSIESIPIAFWPQRPRRERAARHAVDEETGVGGVLRQAR